MRVVYSLELAIDAGDAKTRNLAVHGAGVRWAGLEAHLKAAAIAIDIKGIHVERDGTGGSSDGGANGDDDDGAEV
jgi:hypothetical protein